MHYNAKASGVENNLQKPHMSDICLSTYNDMFWPLTQASGLIDSRYDSQLGTRNRF